MAGDGQVTPLPGFPGQSDPWHQGGQVPPVTLPVPNPEPAGQDNTGIPLYQFVIAIVLLYLLMKFVPGGIYLGLVILAGVFISTPDAVQTVSDFFNFVEGGFR